MEKNKKQVKATDKWLTDILKSVKSGNLSVMQAMRELSVLPYEEMNFAKVDHHRNVRTGFPEVIFCQSICVAASSFSWPVITVKAEA